MSKFSKILNFCGLSSLYSFSFLDKITKADFFTHNTELGSPFLLPCAPTNPNYTRLVVALKPLISIVLRICTSSKVLALIVKLISIYMVSLLVSWRTQNNTMHINGFIVDNTPGIPMANTPFPLVKPLKVSIIYQRIAAYWMILVSMASQLDLFHKTNPIRHTTNLVRKIVQTNGAYSQGLVANIIL